MIDPANASQDKRNSEHSKSYGIFTSSRVNTCKRRKEESELQLLEFINILPAHHLARLRDRHLLFEFRLKNKLLLR
jgi:hypothetical protein